MSGSNCGRAVGNLGIFALSGGMGFGAGTLLGKLLPTSFNAVGRAFLVPGVGAGTATVIDLLASMSLTKQNSLAIYLVGLALGEITGASAEYYLSPVLESAGLTPIQIALINASIAAGSTALFNFIAKAKTCCGDNEQSNDEKMRLMV